MPIRHILWCAPVVAMLSVRVAAQPAAAVHDGKWVGTTSQQKAISFTVREEGVTVLELAWSLRLSEVCPTSPGSAVGRSSIGSEDSYFFFADDPNNLPSKIVAGHFRVVKEVPDDAKISLALTGTFSSPAKSSGSLDVVASACKGAERITWTALREPR